MWSGWEGHPMCQTILSFIREVSSGEREHHIAFMVILAAKNLSFLKECSPLSSMTCMRGTTVHVWEGPLYMLHAFQRILAWLGSETAQEHEEITGHSSLNYRVLIMLTKTFFKYMYQHLRSISWTVYLARFTIMLGRVWKFYLLLSSMYCLPGFCVVNCQMYLSVSGESERVQN